MSHVIFHRPEGTVVIEAHDGQSLYDALSQSNAAGHFDAPCAGRGQCGRCLVRASGALSFSDDTRREDGLYLACKTTLLGDCEVWPIRTVGAIRTADAVTATDDVSLARPDCAPDALGVAVDIGTTTVASFLYRLCDGLRLGAMTQENAGRTMGADVITRMQWVSERDGGRQMADVMRTQLRQMSAALCSQAGANGRAVTEYAICGNTVMLHLLCGAPVRELMQLPFAPADCFGRSIPAETLQLDGAPGAVAYLSPIISAFVGGDTTSALLATQLYAAQEPSFLMDIGTNGELALCHNGQVLCCATASGPAFEGGGLCCGLPGLPGAVDHVFLRENVLTYTTIDQLPPLGLCGSGLLDALSVMLEMGAVDETGRLLAPDEAPACAHPHLGEENGDAVFYIDKPAHVYVSSGDVRHLQLAKGAMAAGVDTLLAEAGLAIADVKNVCLAGGFGTFLRADSAATIGLLPHAWVPVVTSGGNAAGQGVCRLLLSPSLRDEAAALSVRCRTVDLATHPVFQRAFMERIGFENP